MLGAFCREEGECDTSLSKQEGKEPDLAEKGKALGRGGHSGQMLGGRAGAGDETGAVCLLP